MKLIVTTKSGISDEYPYLNYSTTERGELDILDSDNVVIATYNATGWEGVFRIKDDDEDWPDDLFSVSEDEGETGIPTDEDLEMVAQAIKNSQVKVSIDEGEE